MEKKKVKLKSLIIFMIIAVVLLATGGVVFAAGLNNFGNAFTVENGIGQTLDNVGKVVKGELKYVYTEREKLTKTEGGVTTLNVKEVKGEQYDTPEFHQDASRNRTDEKLRYVFGGYKKNDSDDELDEFEPFLNTSVNPQEPDTIEKLMNFLNGHKNPTCDSAVEAYMPNLNNTCKYALLNFYNFYCLLLDKDVVGWHSYLNRLVDSETYDISRNFDPITTYDDYDVHVNNLVATDFDDYFEGSKDNQAAMQFTESWGLVYSVPQAPVPGTYAAIVNRNNTTNMFWGNFAREKAYDFKKIAQNNTTEVTKQNVQSTKYMANASDFRFDSSYRLPGLDDNVGYRFPSTITPSAPTINKYDVRTNYQRTLSRVSNATYFIYNPDIGPDKWKTDKTEYYENPINLYEIDNDGFGCDQDTNTYSYGVTFSRKDEKGFWERAQATIWAGTGEPRFSAIGVSAGSLDDDIYGGEGAEGSVADPDIDGNHDAITAEGYDPNKIVLYLAGRALDLYEEKLAGGKSLDNHNDAVSGSNPDDPGKLMNGNADNLKNKVIVSTKGLGTIAADGSINNDFDPGTDPSKIGSTADATGTILIDDDHYLIGPFLMDDYVYAGSEYVGLYSGKDTDKYKTLIGGIVSGELTFTFDEDPSKELKMQIGYDQKAQIVYENPKDGDYSGDFSEWKAGLKSYSDGGFLQDVDELIKKENGVGYEFPRPKSTFYIKVEKDACEGAQTLKNIRFVYRQTYSDGDGWVIAARYILSSWQAGAIEDGCSEDDYSCENVPTDGEPVTDTHPDCEDEHSFGECEGKRGDGKAGETHHDTCDNCACCPDTDCDHCGPCDDEDCDSGCHCDDCDGFDCTQRVYCEHGYRYCLHTSEYTLIDGAEIIQAQPTLAVHKAIVDLRDYCYDAEVWVRLTTFVSINKYIYDVEHSPEAGNEALDRSALDTSYPDGLLNDPDLGISGYQAITREKISEQKKQCNPLYVEFGDTVIYHIQLLNYQKKDITLKIEDILPEDCRFVSITNITEGMDGINLEGNDFTAEKDIPDGEDVPLIKEPGTGILGSDKDQRTLRTDWILVPGTDDTSDPIINRKPNIITLSVKIIVEYWNNDKLFENKAVIITRNAGPGGTDDWSSDHPIVDYMRVVDNGIKTEEEPHSYSEDSFPFAGDDSVPGPVVNLAELEGEDPTADMPTPKIQSSDWYILNNYNAFMDKFVYRYDEAMQHENNEYKYLKDGYITNQYTGMEPELYYEDTQKPEVLVNARVNASDAEEKLSGATHDKVKHVDPNVIDTVRDPKEDDESKIYTETSKENHPVSVEKSEVLTYAVKVSNEAKSVNKESDSKSAGSTISGPTHLSGSKPATQVRPLKVTDYLEKGLEYISVEAKVYDETSGILSPSKVDKYEVDISESDATNTPYGDDMEGREYKGYEFTIPDESKIILNPGECLIYFVTVKVRESNMYLYDLCNNAEINILTNINKQVEGDSAPYTFKDQYRVVREEGETDLNMNTSLQETSSDWVRLKDLVIAGRVWVDFNRNGYMDEEQITGNDFEKYSRYYNVDEWGRKKEVLVKLYKKGDTTAIRETLTDETGLYTFGRKEDGSSYYDEYNYEEVSGHSKDYSSNDTYQRVDKAESKDGNGNYEDGATYIDYYVEFEYDGVVYRSTEFYSGDDNINRTDGDEFGRYDYNGNVYQDDEDTAIEHTNDQRYGTLNPGYLHNDAGDETTNYSFKYQVDSNAAEFRDVRQKYNAKFEYISYNIAYEANGASPTATKTGTSHQLIFDKKNHISELMEDRDGSLGRYIQARSFINNATLAGTHRGTKIPDDYWADPTKNWDDDGIAVDSGGGTDTTQLLWLCKKEPEQGYEKYPETEYLKHINLGLELREDVDLALTKDVYKVKTTINGEEMEYTYNQNNGLNGDMPADHEYLNDYIIKKPYGLELYESDYKYRYDQYKASEVRDYKGEESELNIEVTYRITVKNKSVSDDDELKEKIGDRTPPVKDTKFDVKLHEVLDLYDQNFMTYNDNPDETINVKTKDERGFLVNTPIKIAEAWYYREGSSGGDDGKTYFVENAADADAKPVYKEITEDVTVPSGATIYIRKNLSVSNSSQGYSNPTRPNGPEKTVDPMENGYKRLYIYGMDKTAEDLKYFTIPEDEERDLYVKYVLDKDTLEIDNVESSWNDTQEVTTRTVDGDFEQVHIVTTSTTGSSSERSLKIAEKAREKLNPRGTENIAQVNGYSVWYSHNGLPASIVDMDSNVGNVGIKNDTPAEDYSTVPNRPTSETSVDDIEYYEDTVYKTGIEIIAENTENTEEKMLSEKGVIRFRRPGITQIKRELTGLVWDDSRTEELDVEVPEADEDKKAPDAKQYLGDGIYNIEKTKSNEAKMNGSIEKFYKDGGLDETKDIEVRNAFAELVEIVQVPVGDEYHYYEEILGNVSWEQTQHTRTGEDGKYKLDGFIPGKYIVRFRYGDTVEGNEIAKQDMQIFNGQDYKTTQYSYELDDYSEKRAKSGTNILEPDKESKEDPYNALKTKEGTIDVYAASLEDKNGVINEDTVLAALERPNLSDARDDEIRRLEVNNYSEVMVNRKAEVLKGRANGSSLTTTAMPGHENVSVNYYSTGKTEDNSTNTPEQLKELTDETNMYAETVEFLVKAEKLTFDQTTLEDYVYYQYTGKPDDLKIYYDKLDNMEYKTVEERNFRIRNVDMGIEYRPETGISLTKEINNIQLVTSDDEVILDLKLYTDLDKDGKLVHHIDTENSIGAELIQFVTNEYNKNDILQNFINVNEEDLQGFAYIAVDDDILQGCKVIIQYKFSAQNDSEVDKISKAIDNIRFYANSRTQSLITEEDLYQGVIKAAGKDGEKFYLNIIPTSSETGEVSTAEAPTKETQYTANNLAKNIVHYDVYKFFSPKDADKTIESTDAQEDVYRDRAKTMIKDDVNTIDDPDGSDGYFGKYVAYTYYIGDDYKPTKPIITEGAGAGTTTKDTGLDVIATLKYDKIIDYVDTDLDFGQLSQTDITKLNNTVGNITTTESRKDTTTSGVMSQLLNVLDQNYTGNQYWSNNSTSPFKYLYDLLYKFNKPILEPSEPSEPGISSSTPTILTNLEGIEYKSLLVTTPDRLYDKDDDGNDVNDENSRNQLFAKFLTPSVVNKDESIATVYLPVSKVLATETDTDNMQYENIAEIIQFTILTGRRTNFDTTIGNADIHEVDKQVTKPIYQPIGSIEFVTAALETDTSSTETITLTPPTGLMRNRRVIREAVDTTTNIIEIAVISIAVVVTILLITKFTIVKIKKKRYK